MSAMSDYLETALLNHLFRDTSFTMPECYAALYTATPSDAGGGTEATGGSYARERIYTDTSTPPYWTAPTDDAGPQKVDNNSDVTFTTASASWGTITSVAILDASTAGNFLFWGALTSSKTVDNGDTFKFATGDLKITLA